jgi:hypothetical protein
MPSATLVGGGILCGPFYVWFPANVTFCSEPLIMTNILYARMDAAVVAWRKVSKMKRDIIGPRNLKTKTP